MKFSAVVALLSAVAAVSALPQALPADDVTSSTPAAASGSCSTGTAQCCSTVKDGQSATDAADLLGLQGLVGSLGLSCQKIPVNVIGAAANVDNQCKQTPVCCTGERHDGLVQVGCTPVPIN